MRFIDTFVSAYVFDPLIVHIIVTGVCGLARDCVGVAGTWLNMALRYVLMVCWRNDTLPTISVTGSLKASDQRE